MTFSVLINNFNYGRFLPETISSVANQTRRPDEVIVVDDGSTDESPAILENLRQTHPWLRIHTQPNSGQLSAMRAGIRLATGDWCFFLDADDLWEPTHLAEAEENLLRHPVAGAYYAGHKETAGPPLYRSKWPAGAIGPLAGLVAVTGVRVGTITSAIGLRRETARKAVDLPAEFDIDWRVRADDVLLYGATFGGAIFVHNPVQTVHYRIHGTNSFANRNTPEHERLYLEHKGRLFAAYRKRFNLDEIDNPARLRDELTKVSRNRLSPEARRRYRRAIRRLDAPYFSRLFAFLTTYFPAPPAAPDEIQRIDKQL